MPATEWVDLGEVKNVRSGICAPVGRTATDDVSGRIVDERQRADQGLKIAVHRDYWSVGLSWPTVLWITLIHVGALAAPFVFTWKGVVLGLALAWISGGLGICLGYHRLLTHCSFTTYPWLRRSFAWLGTLAGEGPPITWVAMHRKHHQFSDRENDPHSPRDGAWWSHMLWVLPRLRKPQWSELANRYAPDLLRDWFMRFLQWSFVFWHLAAGTTLFAVGWTLWDFRTGVSFVVYGMFVRLVYVLHVTWLVNSASHMWGYRNYPTKDNSRNLWWVGLLAYGEGWHNNHHAFPRSAQHGHRWWELDLTYFVIRFMEVIGLAWDVVLVQPD